MLPLLGDDDRDLPPDIAHQRIAGARTTGDSGALEEESGMLVQDVLDHQLDADVSQILVGRHIQRVVPEGQIERVVGRYEVAVIVDGARKTSAAAIRIQPPFEAQKLPFTFGGALCVW